MKGAPGIGAVRPLQNMCMYMNTLSRHTCMPLFEHVFYDQKHETMIAQIDDAKATMLIRFYKCHDQNQAHEWFASAAGPQPCADTDREPVTPNMFFQVPGLLLSMFGRTSRLLWEALQTLGIQALYIRA